MQTSEFTDVHLDKFEEGIEEINEDIENRKEEIKEAYEQLMDDVQEEKERRVEELRQEVWLQEIVEKDEQVQSKIDEFLQERKRLESRLEEVFAAIFSGSYKKEITFRDGGIHQYKKKQDSEIRFGRLLVRQYNKALRKAIAEHEDEVVRDVLFDILTLLDPLRNKLERDEFRLKSDWNPEVQPNPSTDVVYRITEYQSVYSTVQPAYNVGFDFDTENPSDVEILLENREWFIVTLEEIDEYFTEGIAEIREVSTEIEAKLAEIGM